MLRFTPPNILAFTHNQQHKLQSSFVITNPSSTCSAPFKIKCNKPQLFKVRPHVGILLPSQQLQVSITAQHASTPQQGHPQTPHDIKFKVEYAMVENPPDDLAQALQTITDKTKQTHKLFTSQHTPQDKEEARSIIDSCLSARVQKKQTPLERFSPDELSEQQRFQYLKQEIDKKEKERSQMIMAGRPKYHPNYLLLVFILILTIAAGNLTGKVIRSTTTAPKNAKQTQKQKQYGFFGLERLWSKEEQLPVQEQAWWKLWN